MAHSGIRLEAFDQRLAFFAAEFDIVRQRFHRGGGQESIQ